MTMEGYTNLSLIKEEDFQKVGMGHLQGAKNSSRRVYVQQNSMNKGGRNHSLNAPIYQNAPNATHFAKGRKASEASTLPGTRHQYKSQEVGRFNTPLKLPNLKSPHGSKKNSSGTNATLKNHHSNLTTVNENKQNAYDNYGHQKKKSNSRTITQQQHSGSFGSHASGNLKGAPYYQQMVPIKKPPRNTVGMPRNGSNGRGKANYSKINMKPPKWATKEYKPVFRMQSEANPNF